MYQRESGYILITGMIFLLIIALVSVSSLEGVNLDYKISTNDSFKDIAFQNSESGRTLIGDRISYYTYHRQWEGVDDTGLVIPGDYDPTVDVLQTGEDLYDTSTLAVDMTYELQSESIEVMQAAINIVKAPGINSSGSGLQQLAGYEGLGKGAGSGSMFLLYEIRSSGFGPSNAKAVTASEYKVVQ